MPHFRIEGVDRETCAPVSEVVEAPSKDEAVGHVDFLVSKVRKAPKPAEPLPPPAPLPPYDGLLLAAGALRLFGGAGIVIGIVLVLVGIGQWEEKGPSLFAAGVSSLISSVLVYGVGEGLRALRDIAIAVTAK